MNAMAAIRKVETWAEIEQRFTDDREAAIMDLADEGHTKVETARILAMNVQTLRKFIAKNGVRVKFTRKRHHHKKFIDLLAHRRKLSKRNITVTQAAEIEGIHPDTMRIYSDKHGIPWKPSGRWPKVST